MSPPQHPILSSSPVSPTSFPSSATSSRGGHDENSFHHHFETKAWPSTTITTKPSNSHTLQKTSAPLSRSSSPLPPRSGQVTANAATIGVVGGSGSGRQQQQYLQTSSPGRINAFSNKLISGSVNGGGSAVAPSSLSHSRQSLAPTPIGISVLDNNNLAARRQSSHSFFEGRRSTNTTPLRVREEENSTSASIALETMMEPWTSSSSSSNNNNQPKNHLSTEPDDMEQALFEKRLTEDMYGVVVRKIAQNGKSNLRYVKCFFADASELESTDSSSSLRGFGGGGGGGGGGSNRSLSSHSRRFSIFRGDRSVDRTDSLLKGNKVKVLAWGKKKEVKLPVDRFICVRKGKTTERSRRNNCPANRILSLITEVRNCPSLDIEAPTKVDRDKFATAFSRFLKIPLEGGDDVESVRSEVTTQSSKVSQAIQRIQLAPKSHPSSDVVSAANSSATGPANLRQNLTPQTKNNASSRSLQQPQPQQQQQHQQPQSQSQPVQRPPLSVPSTRSSQASTSNRPGPEGHAVTMTTSLATVLKSGNAANNTAATDRGSQLSTPSISVLPKNDDDNSAVSSITGAGYDQELVEELHMALTKMKKELDDSRAEAARAVKVAEQAIQSAENSSSKDWNSTVTHKAAEAAAQAQKRSAEALFKARMAEERVTQERKKADTWRKRAEKASEEAGHWQTRAAVAEVQRAAMDEIVQGTTFQGQKDTLGEVEIDRLRSKLAMESATRRKLLNEVQDLRGQIRVYCRPLKSQGESTISSASQEVLVLHRERNPHSDDTATPLRFEFDGIIPDDCSQRDVYNETEAVCLSVLDGYNACLMAYGQRGTGKTYTMLGDVSYGANGDVSITNFGIHLQAAQQYFQVLKQRSGRFEETISLSLVEVTNERITDLLATTQAGKARGVVELLRKSKSRKDGLKTKAFDPNQQTRLEIKNSMDGEISVEGCISILVRNFDDVLLIWKQALKSRRQRLVDQGLDFQKHETNSHVIASFRVRSKSTTSGISTSGKIQFVDLAASDIVHKRASNKKASPPELPLNGLGIGADLKFANRSMASLSEVVTARSQFHRSVPYRNATITHLLSDSLEADTKVVLLTCVSSDAKDFSDTSVALQFSETARKIVIGKATKHTSIS